MGKYELASAESTYYENETYVGSKSELFGDSSAARKKRIRYILAAAVLLVCVTTLAFGLGFGLSQKSSGGSEIGTPAPFGGNISVTPTTAGHTTNSGPPGVHTSPTSNTHNTTPGNRLTTTERKVDWLSQRCIKQPNTQNSSSSCPWRRSPVLLVSLDGFRADYLLRNLTPVIQKLRACGIHTPFMRAVYPTLTFPNHYTIVTGLYPESHGIVGNSMYDSTLNKSFSLSRPEKYDPRWWGGEPLWITAKKQGRRTASYFWVGSDVNISGIQPDVWKKYDGKTSFERRVDTVLDWLAMPEGERPDFITLYFDEPDHAGHGGGPSSTQVNAALAKVDRALGRLMDGLARYNIHDCVNLIVIADHGMESTSCQRQVDLKDYITIKDKLIFGGTTGHINPHYHKLPRRVVASTTNATSADDMVKSLQCKDPHLDVFTRDTIPKRHHYSNNARIGDVVLDVAARWLVYDKYHRGCLKGNHGYDNIYKSMHALFLAHGPDFKQNFTAKPFENIELYNLMSELLEITPAPNNGTFGSLHEMLKAPSEINETGQIAGQCKRLLVGAPADDCNCANQTGIDWDMIFTGSVTNHITVDIPRTTSENNICILYQNGSTTGYSWKLRSPMWSSVTVVQGNINNTFSQACIVTDPRTTSNPINCSSRSTDDTSLTPLFMSDAAGRMHHVYLSSEVVPMYNSFKAGIWTFVWDLISDYANQYGPLSVTTGPIYDYNHDGLWEGLTNNTRLFYKNDMPIPTHIYVIIVRCQDKTDHNHCDIHRNVLSFIIPHVQHIPNCLREDLYLKDNVARVRDIEILTGLTFMSKSNVAIQLRTFLPENIWPTTLVKHWLDTPCPTPAMCNSRRSPVLLVSLDGFRADYLLRNLTPVIQKLTTCGVHTPYMRAVYPTLTFPNHYTIVTGLYPESHGIVGNSMYDATLNKSFSIGSPETSDPRWWGGEPLWITAKKQRRRTASYFWVGSDVNISGIQPDIWKKYGKATFQQRVDTVIDWLALPEDQRPDFITLYFDQPDHAGHGAGPNSEDVNVALEEVDASLGRLMDGLLKHNLQDCVNIIVVADHGMDSTSCERQVGLNRYISIKDKLIFGGTTGHINPNYQSHTVGRHHTKVFTTTENAKSADDMIKSLQCKDPHLDVFTRDTIPKRHHYSNNARIGDVVLDVAARWLVYGKELRRCLSGNHGYDNIYKSMHALFLAHGPAFKHNYTAEPFENIELYNMMAELLGIQPAPNNGTIGSLHGMLNKPGPLKPEGNPVGKCNISTADIQQTTCTCADDINMDWDELTAHNTTANLALGDPRDTSDDSVCVLLQAGSTTGYSAGLGAPVWTYIAVTQQSVNQTGDRPNTNENETCIVSDSRISEMASNCSIQHDNISLAPLFVAGLAGRLSDVYLSSEVIPMYEGFRTGIWTFVWDLISDYANLYGTLSVTTGPIYDYNHDGLWEGLTNNTELTEDGTPIPTHVYVIIVRCQESTDQLPCGGQLAILPFVIPHLQEIPNCRENHTYLMDNVARIRDIEILTGLAFMTTFKPSVALPLRTFLPENIWRTTLIQRWIDMPCPQADVCKSERNPVLLVSLDGFRADYLLRNITPVIQKLRTCGVHTPYMRAVYPTLTFPNHYTIVTGLYPESHGIVGNHMYDSTINKLFSISGKEKNDPRWWGGEPLWVTAKKQGRRTASYFWVGSEVNISGMQPDIWERYSSKISFEKRVDTVLQWLTLPQNERPDFITLYFNQPDHAAHSAGPDSAEVRMYRLELSIYQIISVGYETVLYEEFLLRVNSDGAHQARVNAALQQVDSILGRLMEGLKRYNMQDCVNLIVVADHGMEATSCDRQVDLDKYMSVDDKLIFGGTTGHIDSNFHKLSSKSKVVEPTANATSPDAMIKSLQCKDPHLDVFTRDTIPKRHHYSNNARIGDVVLDIAARWLVYETEKDWCLKGNHGYDTIYKSMHALFLAHGPAFKRNFTAEPFENIELYNMMTELLGITPAPNNGTSGSLHGMLMRPGTIEAGGHTTSTCNIPANSKGTTWMCGCPADTDVDDELFTHNVTDNATFGDPRTDNATFGDPQTTSRDDVCIMNQTGSSVGYSWDLRSPIWSIVTVPRQVHAMGGPFNLTCIADDPRIPENGTVDCSLFNSDGVSLAPLFHAGLAGRRNNVHLWSEVVPMFYGFKSGIWTLVWDLISDYANQYGPLSVTTGPIYDYNHDGLWEGLTNNTKLTHVGRPIPTHIYVIIVRCQTKGDNLPCDGAIDLLPFILPHVQAIPNCLTRDKYIRDNVARIRDIELLTGVTFMTALKPSVAVPVRTFLPEQIWPTTS